MLTVLGLQLRLAGDLMKKSPVFKKFTDVGQIQEGTLITGQAHKCLSVGRKYYWRFRIFKRYYFPAFNTVFLTKPPAGLISHQVNKFIKKIARIVRAG